MLSLERGHKSPIFSKNKRSLHPEHLSFSVYYQLTNQREEKTLDVVCKDQIEYDNWVTGLMWLIENKEEITAAAHELEGPESTGRRGSLKIVDVENLRKEMNAHLDLCTWGNSAWGQLGHADKPEEIKDISFPMVPLSRSSPPPPLLLFILVIFFPENSCAYRPRCSRQVCWLW
jgi:hypothetical protein